MVFLQLRPTGSYDLKSDDLEAIRRAGDQSKGVGTLGVKLFLASLSFLFGASILLYLVVLLPAAPPEQPVLPVVGLGLALSTMVMLASSFTYWLALRAIGEDDRQAFRRMMTWTLVLGLGFMASQGYNWWELVASGLPLDASNRYSALFLVMTVLHALHVVGGLIPLAVVTAKARRGEYTAKSHEGATNVSLYWHFLDVVWLLMLVAIVIATA
ncbi:cytochrome c oxidase subunit 3 [Engelhardtia mirabilis]|uniref:Cytochrome c oxidase subunit 3 n=1 Tax=Engelhardtia mirabilis TaxID=2528011 RepID=A0A518BH15_9BACT|nr:Cytochrome c oxidase subunit 3 [Planctomycetes bacterium Pla133]QDV00604.1 Cytochrome c oxidase subunit 3 [Planctomycetes bacterium Pla86]